MTQDHAETATESDIDHWRRTRLDRSVCQVESLVDATDDAKIWLARTPEERLAHLEFLRRLNYGDAACGRLQRVLEVVHRPASGRAKDRDDLEHLP